MAYGWEHKQKEGTSTTQQFSSPTGMACTTMTMGGQQVRGPARKEHAGVRSGAFPGVMCSTTNAPYLSRSSAAVAARAPTCQAATRRHAGLGPTQLPPQAYRYTSLLRPRLLLFGLLLAQAIHPACCLAPFGIA